MEKKIDAKNIIEEIASKFGCKLVKIEVENPAPEMPITLKKYEEMDSRALTLELKEIDADLRKLDALDSRIKEAITKFMNEQQPNNYSTAVFEGQRFDTRRLTLVNKEMTMKSNLQAYVNSLLKRATEKEMTDRFLGLNPEFVGIVKDISLKQSPVGASLSIEICKIAEKGLDKFAEEINATKKGATTSASISGAQGRG